MRQLMCSWLWKRESIGWATAPQLSHVLLELMHSCLSCSLPVFRSRLFSVWRSNRTQEWGKFARSLDLDPDESEAQSARCGAWAWWIIDSVADSFSRLAESPNSSAALLKLNYSTTRWMKCFPKTLDLFNVSLCARPCVLVCKNKTQAQTNSLPCFKWPVRFSSFSTSSSQHSFHREVSAGRLFVLCFALLATEEMSNCAESALSSPLIPSLLNLDLCSRFSLFAMRLVLWMFGLAVNNSNLSPLELYLHK